MGKTVTFIFVNLGLILFSLEGCAIVVPRTVTAKEEVTIPQAMTSIACGLKTYQNELARLDLNTGTFLDEAEVTLVLKASATGKSELVVDGKASPVVGGIVPLAATYKDTLEQVGSRENTIRLKFRNLRTATLNKPGEAQLNKQLPPLGLSPSILYPVDKPCESVRIPEDYRILQNRGVR